MEIVNVLLLGLSQSFWFSFIYSDCSDQMLCHVFYFFHLLRICFVFPSPICFFLCVCVCVSSVVVVGCRAFVMLPPPLILSMLACCDTSPFASFYFTLRCCLVTGLLSCSSISSQSSCYMNEIFLHIWCTLFIIIHAHKMPTLVLSWNHFHSGCSVSRCSLYSFSSLFMI